VKSSWKERRTLLKQLHLFIVVYKVAIVSFLNMNLICVRPSAFSSQTTILVNFNVFVLKLLKCQKNFKTKKLVDICQKALFFFLLFPKTIISMQWSFCWQSNEFYCKSIFFSSLTFFLIYTLPFVLFFREKSDKKKKKSLSIYLVKLFPSFRLYH
jgi:hypothetical protein